MTARITGDVCFARNSVPNSWAELPVVLDFFTRLGIVWPLAHRDDWPLISGGADAIRDCRR
jgi:hypothetical protein